MENDKFNIKITLFALFVLIVWDSLKVYLNFQSSVIQLGVLAPILFVGVSANINSNFWKILFSKPIIIWIVWILYSLVNTFLIVDKVFQGYNPMIFTFSIITVPIFMLLIVNNKANSSVLLNFIIFSYFIRLLLSFVFDSFTYTTNRFGADYNANSVAYGALLLIGMFYLKKIQKNTNKKDYIVLLLSIVTILLTGSRKNFLAMLFIFIGVVYVNRSPSAFKNIVKYSFFVLLIVIASLWVMNNTIMGERFVDSFYSSMEHREAGRDDKLFDSRGRYYIHGWALFKEHPINGIGLRNFQAYDYVGNNLHSEYMTQLTEGGIIGTFIFLYFYAYLFYSLFKIRKRHKSYRKISETYLLLLMVMLILFFGSWIYRDHMMWVFIALAIRFIKEVKQHNLQVSYDKK